MGNLIRAMAVVGVTSASVLALAAPSFAEPSPPGCAPGNFCIYSRHDQTGTLVLKTAGNWSGSVTGVAAFNNGVPWPGADHVQVDSHIGDHYESRCMHYNPGPGEYKRDFLPGTVFTKVVWRGEC